MECKRPTKEEMEWEAERFESLYRWSSAVRLLSLDIISQVEGRLCLGTSYWGQLKDISRRVIRDTGCGWDVDAVPDNLDGIFLGLVEAEIGDAFVVTLNEWAKSVFPDGKEKRSLSTVHGALVKLVQEWDAGILTELPFSTQQYVGYRLLVRDFVGLCGSIIDESDSFVPVTDWDRRIEEGHAYAEGHMVVTLINRVLHHCVCCRMVPTLALEFPQDERENFLEWFGQRYPRGDAERLQLLTG
jgi:hypothetical protein